MRRGEMTNLDAVAENGQHQEESRRYIELPPEMELALGRTLMPVFAGYLLEMGFLETAEHKKKEERDEMNIEETVARLAGAQLEHTFRLSRIEEGFQQIGAAIQQLTQIVDLLKNDVAALNGRFERIDSSLERAAKMQSENAGQIKALIESQASTDEQIRLLLGRSRSTTKLKTVKTAKKAVKKKTEK
jgi:hypothetical protein